MSIQTHKQNLTSKNRNREIKIPNTSFMEQYSTSTEVSNLFISQRQIYSAYVQGRCGHNMNHGHPP